MSGLPLIDQTAETLDGKLFLPLINPTLEDKIRRRAQIYYETRCALGILPRSEEERQAFQELDWRAAEEHEKRRKR